MHWLDLKRFSKTTLWSYYNLSAWQGLFFSLRPTSWLHSLPSSLEPSSSNTCIWGSHTWNRKTTIINNSRHLLSTYSVLGSSKTFKWIHFLIFSVPPEGAIWIKNNLETWSISGKLFKLDLKNTGSCRSEKAGFQGTVISHYRRERCFSEK